MLSWALTFFVLALIAGFFGFGGIAFAAAGIAKFLFFVFIILFFASFFFRVTEKADEIVDRNL